MANQAGKRCLRLYGGPSDGMRVRLPADTDTLVIPYRHHPNGETLALVYDVVAANVAMFAGFGMTALTRPSRAAGNGPGGASPGPPADT